MGNREDIEAALSATADRLTPGSGAGVLKRLKNDIVMVASPTDDDVRRHTRGDLLLVAPAVFEPKPADGDRVTIAKARDGLIAVFSDGVVLVRGIAFGAKESKGYAPADVSAEPVTTVLEGADVPGLRISGRHGKPHVVLAITAGQGPGDAAAQAAVRDEILGLVAR